ncbi:acetyltransferase [Martelella alba]|uniref:Acetyltransferase n=1 Tax=Martelella alba TaxID=2590451 RepID=A0A506UG01_9HYPH|nr:GNAT family N-acetyltransferase [Martelella alba]TPW32281.1 acetyltransferase [Martelella alba]
MTDSQYGFRRATMDDLALIMAWRSRPHVRKWWDLGKPYSEEEMADPRVARWIVSTNERPFAFMQDYSVHGWADHHFASLPEGSRGIDQFIGEPGMIGLGHGTAFIRARMKTLFDEGAAVIATDPHPDNLRAIAAYKKAGFEAFCPPRETRWGRILPMMARQRGQHG